MTQFKGQHANEKILALIHQSGVYWLKLSFRWWIALSIFLGLCVFFVSIFTPDLIGLLAIWVLAEFTLLLILVSWHLRQRAKKRLFITNERIVRFNGKAQFSMNLDEIRDIQSRKYKKFSDLGEITFTAVTPLKIKHIPDVQALATYVNELLRLQRSGSKVFPKYKNH